MTVVAKRTRKIQQAEAQAEVNGRAATAWLIQAAEAKANGNGTEYARCMKCFSIMRDGRNGQARLAANLKTESTQKEGKR